MEKYLNNLEELYPEKLEDVTSDLGDCCSNFMNHSLSSEKIICRICGMDINDNIFTILIFIPNFEIISDKGSIFVAE